MKQVIPVLYIARPRHRGIPWWCNRRSNDECEASGCPLGPGSQGRSPQIDPDNDKSMIGISVRLAESVAANAEIGMY